MKENKKIPLFLVLNVESNRTPEENLGVYYLQDALLKEGIESDYRDLWLENLSTEEFVNQYDFNKVLFIGISCCISNLPEVKELIEYLDNKIPVVVGGYGGTFDYKNLLDIGCDLVSLGEGDFSIIDIYNYYNNEISSKNDIHNIAYKKEDKIVVTNFYNPICLDDLTIEIKRKYLNLILEKKSTVNILSSKGCLGNCIYCSIRKFYHNKCSCIWRGMSIDNLIATLKYYFSNGVKVFKIIDDSFLEKERNIDWCRMFAKKVKENKLEILYRISIRPCKVREEPIQYLKSAGLFAVSCGIESGSPTALKRMHKYENASNNQQALDIFEKNNILVQAGFILFDDMTTMKELRENLEFLKKNKKIIIKGIFSEMYAAEGSDYANYIINKYPDCVRKNGNYVYEIQDLFARKVYYLLKIYQRKNCLFYDKLIDPISAPKALNDINEYFKIYNLYLEVHKIDLDYFEYILNLVNEDSTIDENQFEKICDNYILSNKEKIENINNRLSEIYLDNKLEFSATISRFL